MTEGQFTPQQEAGISSARAAMRTLPEAMDRQAYETLSERAKQLHLEIIYHHQFLRSQGLLEAYDMWLALR